MILEFSNVSTINKIFIFVLFIKNALIIIFFLMMGFLKAFLNFFQKHACKTNIILSVIILGLSIKCIRMARKASRLENRNIKRNVIELIGNTPLIYLESLSRLTKCHIYVINLPLE